MKKAALRPKTKLEILRYVSEYSIVLRKVDVGVLEKSLRELNQCTENSHH